MAGNLCISEPNVFVLCVSFPFFSKCRDVRTREVGIQEIHHKVRPYQVGFVSFLGACFRHNFLCAFMWRCWDPFVAHPFLWFAFVAGSNFPFIFSACLDVFSLSAVTC